MTLARLRIGIAGAGSSDFASTPIPVLQLAKHPDGDFLSTRSEINNLSLAGRSIAGTPASAVTAFSTKYQWEITAALTVDEVLQLGALAEWQKDNPTTGLRLIDEYEYLDPVASQPRTLLATINPSWNGAYVYGFGVFSVYLLLEPGWRQRLGIYNNDFYEATFRIEEL